MNGGIKKMKSMEYIQLLAKTKQPIMAYNEEVELAKWQEEAHKKMSELLGLPLEYCDNDFQILEEKDLGEYMQIRFNFQSEEGYYVPCSLLVPKGANGPLPCVICLQGHSTGAHISLGIPKFDGDEEMIAGGRDFAVQAVKEGYCAIALEMRYMGEMGQSQSGHPSCVTSNAAMSTLLMGRTAIGERVWDVHRLIDVIETHLTDCIDTKNIMCMGNSGGGTVTFYAACYDKRICLAIPSCSVCTYDDSIIAMKHCGCNFIPGIRKYFNMGDLGCLVAPRPLIVVCGIHDPIFPLHGVEDSYAVIKKAYKKVGKEELCQLVRGDGGHQFYPDDVWPIVSQMIK